MTFFDQQAVVCPKCKTRYALGQFTEAELQHFGIQLKIGYWKHERDKLLTAQALLSLYPELNQLKEVDYSFWNSTTVEDWLVEHGPTAAGRSFTKEDRLALEVLKVHRFSQANCQRRLKWVAEKLDRLKPPLNSFTVYCPNCGDALKIDPASLVLEYRWALEDMVGGIEELNKGGCWGCIMIFGVPAIWGLIAGPMELKIGCMFILYILMRGIRNLWPKKLKLADKQLSTKYIRGKEKIFRGRYLSSAGRRFEWLPDDGKQERKCRLLIPNDITWAWCQEIVEEEQAKVGQEQEKVSAEFEVEFRGLQIAKGQFVGEDWRRIRDADYLVEVLEMRSVKLVKVNHKTVPAEELLRPSLAPDTANDELLHPVHERRDCDPAEMLRGFDAGENTGE